MKKKNSVIDFYKDCRLTLIDCALDSFAKEYIKEIRDRNADNNLRYTKCLIDVFELQKEIQDYRNKQSA